MVVPVVLFGDSITEGIGSRRISFQKDLQEMLGIEYGVENRARTGSTVDFGLESASSGLPKGPGIAVVLYGNVDAQIRPSRTGMVFRRLPRRFRRPGMLMPRPFYSSRPLRRLGELIDDRLRLLFSKIIRWVDGTEQWVSLDDFRSSYIDLVKVLQAQGFAVVCCSCVYIDEKLFPGSSVQYERFNSVIDELAGITNSMYVDLFNGMRRRVRFGGWESSFGADHFHPNPLGYKFVASEIFRAIGSDSSF